MIEKQGLERLEPIGMVRDWGNDYERPDVIFASGIFAILHSLRHKLDPWIIFLGRLYGGAAGDQFLSRQ